MRNKPISSIPKKSFNGYDNSKWKCLSPEDLKIGKKYSFTLNPLLQYFDCEKRVQLVQEFVFDLLLHLDKSFNCKLVMEISKGGRIHYHGCIEFKDIIKFFIHNVNRLQSNFTYEIDEINGPEKWQEYVVKQKDMWPDKRQLEINIDDKLREKLLFTTVKKVKNEKNHRQSKEILNDIMDDDIIDEEIDEESPID